MAGVTTAIAASSKQKARDYLGLAILDADLNGVIADTIVDLKQAGFPAAQDFRLFVFQNQIYISSYDLIAPVWLTSTALNNPMAAQTIIAPAVVRSSDKLQVRVGKQPACSPCLRKRGFCGKNFTYFVSMQLHIWPTGPHTVRSIELDQSVSGEKSRAPQRM
jgi:hypothetical protein